MITAYLICGWVVLVGFIILSFAGKLPPIIPYTKEEREEYWRRRREEDDSW